MANTPTGVEGPIEISAASPGPESSALRSLYLLYHEVRNGPSRYAYIVPADMFQRQIDLFAELRGSQSNLLRPEITFDDGHISNHEIAAPLLASRGLTAHFFITTGWTGMKPGYMGWAELRALHNAGHVIGAHGWTHTLLTHCDDRELEMELVQPRIALEDKLGAAVTTMSLPGGRGNARVLAACRKAGYSRIFTSVPSPSAVPPSETIGRLNILGGMRPEWLRKVLDPSTGLLASLERRQRIKDMVKSALGDRLYAALWARINRHEPEDTPA